MSKLQIVPIDRKEAEFFVENIHRHLPSVNSVNTKFQLGCALGDKVVGVAIVGRPVARMLCDGWTLEVNRVATDGTKNATSMLYAACWRAARAMGYRKLITYTHKTESGASLRGAGWKIVAEVSSQSWNCPSRPRIDTSPLQEKFRWEIE